MRLPCLNVATLTAIPEWGMAECVSEFRIEAEWDEDKDRTNLAKHGVDFETAASVFYDPLAMTAYDPAHSIEEERWNTVGCARNGSVLFVATQSRIGSQIVVQVRIISARKATKAELGQYQENS